VPASRGRSAGLRVRRGSWEIVRVVCAVLSSVLVVTLVAMGVLALLGDGEFEGGMAPWLVNGAIGVALTLVGELAARRARRAAGAVSGAAGSAPPWRRTLVAQHLVAATVTAVLVAVALVARSSLPMVLFGAVIVALFLAGLRARLRRG
jgi:hypothetical protein